jgi:hypothetical protein
MLRDPNQLLHSVGRASGSAKSNSNAARLGDLASLAIEHVYRDLEKFLEGSVDRRKRLKHMAKRTNIHEKTLLRLSRRENRPTYITIFKIYRHLLDEDDDAKLLGRVPKEVADYLNHANPQTISQTKSYSADVELEMRTNPVLAELMVLCATGPVKLEYVKSRFGDFGLQVVELGLKRNFFQTLAKNEICRGSQQVNMAPETIASVAVQMMRSHLKPEKCYATGENFLGFYAAGLNDEAYQKWLAIDADAFQRKIEIAKQMESRGNIRAFTAQAIEHAEIERSNLSLPQAKKSWAISGKKDLS